MTQVSEYEVRCPRCDVSFPKGTKKCMHCGGRTGPSVLRGPRMTSRHAEERLDPMAPEQGIRIGDEVVRPLPVDFEEEEPTRRSGLLRALITVVWIGLAVAFSMARACSES